MRFLRRSTQDTPADEANDTVEVVGKGHTAGKGRATPKRRDAEGKRRGPVAPPPTSMREAMKRNREIRKSNPVTKEQRRDDARTRREAMMSGDERYLLPRDKGPVKAYVRDLVDSRRNILGLFMPMAIVIFVALLFLQTLPRVQSFVTLVCTAMLLVMAVEGVFNGRRIIKAAREKFPKETIRGGSLGWYAFVRASQVRKLRAPRPRVKPGEPIPN